MTQSASTILRVSGMTCNNCSRHVTEALQSVPGVASVVTSLENGVATVRWAPGANHSIPTLLQVLHEAGYAGEEKSGHNQSSIFEGWEFNVILGSIITLPLIVLEWFFGAGLAVWYKWLSFALVLPLQTLGGWRFYRGAWMQLKAGQSNMDTLVSLGSTTAFLYSVWGLLAGWNTHLFFMDAAAIITLVSLGHYMEQKTSARAASSLKNLLQLAPATARKLEGTNEVDVPVAELRAGNVIVLKPGDRVPIDGEVVEGESALNESMLTGESMPVEKRIGDKVLAGTINESGTVRVQVRGIGEQTALARIIEIVQKAQSSRAEIQRLGDKVSSVFVPVVVLIALVAFLGWGFFPETARRVHDSIAPYLWSSHAPVTGWGAAIFYAAAVLIIACPCAMGLATPVAIMAGTNVAARRGILIRDGAALEKSGRITAVLFDKTGTLTEGKLTARMNRIRPDLDPDLGPALARHSMHPVSKAIAALSSAALPSSVRYENWREVRGAGVEARNGAGTYRLGRLDWLAQHGVVLPSGSPGGTVVGLALERELLAYYSLSDSLKPKAREVISVLQRSGYATYMVTGDNPETAKEVAAAAGIPEANVFSNVRPEGKLAVIDNLRRSGQRVAFAGDGINDAPALKGADLGIALMNATDVAREQSDIVLLKADLAGIPESLALARATLRTIKQNLFWAFFYNALGVPLAALGFLSPMISALAMGLSDLVVIGNALRLKRDRSGA